MTVKPPQNLEAEAIRRPMIHVCTRDPELWHEVIRALPQDAYDVRRVPPDRITESLLPAAEDPQVLLVEEVVWQRLPPDGLAEVAPVVVLESERSAAPALSPEKERGSAGDVALEFVNRTPSGLASRLWGAVERALLVHALRIHRRELRQMKREAREARDALASSEERYRILFEANPEAVLIAARTDGRILAVNSRFEDLYGWDRQEAVGRTAHDLKLLARTRNLKRLDGILNEWGSVREFRTTCRTRGGAEREVEISAECLELQKVPCVLILTRDVTEQAEFQRDLERMALFDTLTDLPNRNLFGDRLRHALERGRRRDGRVALLFLDLDRFKVVNDTLGHSTGDDVLALTAERIRGCFREEDTVARLGGDEFAVILEDDPTVHDAEAAARRVLEALEPPFPVGDTEVRLGASVGIALASGAEVSQEDLLRFSDVAMYAAKREGGGQYRVFDPGRDAEATLRLHLENELRRALERKDELFLLFQPLVELASGRVVGGEGLIRWDHPERGLLEPADFLTLAEETGLIVPLGVKVLRMACLHIRRWSGQLPPEFFLSVNLSPFHLAHTEVAEDVVRALEEHGVDPQGIALEITEGALIEGPRGIANLCDVGVRVAIDDFGTGHSSLTYLKDLNVDLLKLDRSFVAGLGERRVADRLLVQSVLLFARGMDIDVVAEGVETEEQREALRELGCEFGQGFHFAEPMDATTFLGHLQDAKSG